MSDAPETPGAEPKPPRWGNSRLGQWIARHEFVANVLTLMTGTAFAQVVGILIYPIVTRLYPPADMGIFSMFMALVGFLVTVAALRYDLAIVPAANDDEARTLISLATRCNLVVSLLATVVLFAFGPAVERIVNTQGLAAWLWAVGPVVFATAQVGIYGYWLTRKKQYRLASTNQMLQSLGLSVSRVGFGFAGAGVLGLIVSQLTGVALALGRVFWRTRGQLSGPRVSTRRQMARKFKRMPLVNGPNALVDAIRLNGITLLIGRFFGREDVGNFGVAWTLIQAPLSLINGALSQVFFQKLAVTPRGDMFRVVKASLVRSALLGVVPFALIFFLGPPLMPWVLGQDYALVGVIAAVLVPWLFFNLATSPISMLFVVVQKQGALLIFGVIYMIVPLSILWFYHPGIVETMTVVSLAMAGLLLGFCIMALWAAREFDAGRTPDISADQES